MGKAKPPLGRTWKNVQKFPATVWRQRVTGYHVPLNPKFDSEEATQWFVGRLASARSYLEWGSGGSTVAAARLGIPFTSIESDRFFLEAVKKQILQSGYSNSNQEFRHAGLGITSAWGRPLLPRPVTASLCQKFRAYSDVGGRSAETGNAPDLALVDGRFRVACALKFLLCFGSQDNWTLAIDDFGTRSHYVTIGDFATLECLVGRLAVFKPGKTFDETALRAAIARYELNDD